MLGFCATTINVMAGNRDRSGQSGAQHLLIDPWARSAGWASCGVAETRGLESVFGNVAGIAFAKRTEVAFSHTQYLTGSAGGININAFGISQGLFYKSKETGRRVDLGTIAVSVFSMGFGDIQVTTVDQPEHGVAIFSPKLNYIGVHYAKSFNRFIHGGVSFKIINESISDLRANGIAIDVGVQYLAGAYDNFKIGVTLQNLGLPMSYRGDGIAVRAQPEGTRYIATLEHRQAQYELPALLTIGLSYDFLIFDEAYQSMDKEDRRNEGLTRLDALHRITLAGSFTANAYSRDQFALGLEYGFRQFLQIRAGYMLQSFTKRTIDGKDQIYVNADSFYLGPSAGVTVGVPLVKKGRGNNQILLIDYAYRFTHFWKGNHYIGLKFCL
jgi:hypothetical protein